MIHGANMGVPVEFNTQGAVLPFRLLVRVGLSGHITTDPRGKVAEAEEM